VPSDKKTQFERRFSVASQTDEDVLGKWINSPRACFIDSHFSKTDERMEVRCL
jgi:hypothetical protein